MWTTRQLASALTLTAQRIGQLEKSGIIPKRTAAGHDPFKAVPAYLRFFSRRLTGTSLDAARVAKYQIDTALQKLRYRREEGDLVERQAVYEQAFSCWHGARDILLGFPDRLAGLVSAETDQLKNHAVLAREIHQLLEDLSHDPTIAKACAQAEPTTTQTREGQSRNGGRRAARRQPLAH